MIYEIPAKTAYNFLMGRHYAGRKPSIVKAFADYRDGDIQAVCTFGKPASHSLCIGVCGEKYSHQVYELNRLCAVDDYDKPLSQFVGHCLRSLKMDDWIIVSYADTAMNHNGYIYQSCNFLYTGCTKERTDFYSDGNKHSRHAKNTEGARKVRSAKHRYIYFCSKDRKLKKEWKNNLRYRLLPYPKGENKRYMLGETLKPTVVFSDKYVEEKSIPTQYDMFSETFV